MKKEFKSTQHILFQLIFIGLPVLVAIVLINSIVSKIQLEQSNQMAVILMIILIFIIIISLWLLIKSFRKIGYKVFEDKLCFKFGPIKGAIPVSKIKSIKKASYPLAGNRPALDLTGLKIIYGEGYSIFISPEYPDELIEQLKNINKEIRT